MEKTVKEIFENIVDQYPDRLAVVSGSSQLTYRALDVAANKVANFLIQKGINVGDSVVLAAGRSVHALVGMIGIVKAGAAYVPVELESSAAGLENILEQTRAKFILTVSELLTLFPMGHTGVLILDSTEGAIASCSSQRPIRSLGEQTNIYVLFTSGSTGKPKGVEVTHANIIHYTESLTRQLAVPPNLNFAYVSSMSADLGNTSLFISIFTGGTLHLIDQFVRRDSQQFKCYLKENKIDFIKITPSHLDVLFDRAKSLDEIKLKYLVFGGEKLSTDLLQWVIKSGLTEQVINHYGPTETTVGVIFNHVRSIGQIPEAAQTVPLGFAIGQSQLILVDQEERPISGTGTGELFIGGPSVAKGYLGNADLTDQKFVFRDFGIGAKGRFYRTGDLCRRHIDDSLEFIGRIDRQIKVRGFRVDPEVVEDALRDVRGIRNAAVMLLNSVSSEILVSAVITENGETPDATDLSHKLSANLPEYMIPGEYHVFDQFPINSNGKVDLKRLQDWVDERRLVAMSREVSVGGDLPRSQLEKNLIDELSSFLKRPNIGPLTNLIALTGDSVVNIRLVTALQKKGYRITSQQFLANPTIRGLANLIETLGDTPKSPPVLQVNDRILGPIQRWFFNQGFANQDHWNQALLIQAEKRIDPEVLLVVVRQLLAAHELLRTTFQLVNGVWTAAPSKESAEKIMSVEDMSSVLPEMKGATFQKSVENLHKEISIRQGSVVRIRLFRGNEGEPDLLLIICHHLVVDGISWRILIDDLCKNYKHALQGEKVSELGKDNAYWHWTQMMASYRNAVDFKSEEVFWTERTRSAESPPKVTLNNAANNEGESEVIWIGYDPDQTDYLIKRAVSNLDSPIQNILLCAFVRAASAEDGIERFFVDIENHGRELVDGTLIEIGDSLGWFTALFPLSINIPLQADFKSCLRSITDDLDQTPNKGVGYGLLDKSYGALPAGFQEVKSRYCFNFLGRFSIPEDVDLQWQLSRKYCGPARGMTNNRIYDIKFTGRIVDHRLVIDISYSRNMRDRKDMDRFCRLVNENILNLLPESIRRQPSEYKEPRTSSGLLIYCPEKLIPQSQEVLFKHPQCILLTGASGFLGIHLLRSLLDSTSAKIVCLVRSNRQEDAWSRLNTHFKWHFPEYDFNSMAARVEVVMGNVQLPNLGLEPGHFNALAHQVEMIIHSAADVRLFGDPKEVEATNLGGTQNILDFAVHGFKKEVHYISTLSVVGVNRQDGIKTFSELDFDNGQEFQNHYEYSKFQSEKMIRRYADNGGEAYIYRSGNISADSMTARFQRNIGTNRLLQTLRGYILSESAPDSISQTLVLSQVDVVAKGIVAIAIARHLSGGVFHVESPHEISMETLVQYLNTAGFTINVMPVKDHLTCLSAAQDKLGVDLSLAELWSKQISERPRNAKFDCHSTQKLLKKLGVEFPCIDSKWVKKLIEHCFEVGFLNREK